MMTPEDMEIRMCGMPTVDLNFLKVRSHKEVVEMVHFRPGVDTQEYSVYACMTKTNMKVVLFCWKKENDKKGDKGFKSNKF